MGRYSDIIIEWPTCIPSLSTWWHWLQQGFRDIGCHVVLKTELADFFANTPQKGVLCFHVKREGRERRVWYDSSDFLNGYYELIHGDDLYFKIMLAPGDMRHDERIRPIGQSAASVHFPKVLESFRAKPPGRVHDVVFMGRATDNGLRARAVKIIRAHAWRSVAYLAPHPKREKPPVNILGSKLSFAVHLDMLRATKVCPAFPGVGGPWTWRHTEILGLGRMLIMPETDCVQLPFAHQWCVTCAPDLSDFVDKVNYYLKNDYERESIAQQGHAYYKGHLEPRAQALYVLREMGFA